MDTRTFLGGGSLPDASIDLNVRLPYQTPTIASLSLGFVITGAGGSELDLETQTNDKGFGRPARGSRG